MTGSERRLAAIMFTDIVGYSALTQKNERLALKLLEKHRELIRPVLRRHGGTEVKTMGDAFLVEFRSALEATRCGIEIQKVLHDYNQRARTKVKVRIGIHVGDVVHKAGDVFGDAVNIASRIEPMAAGGEVCISQQVYDQIRNKLRYPLIKLESHDMKNVAFPVDVYRVVLPWAKGQKRVVSTKEPLVKVVKRFHAAEHKAMPEGVGKYIQKLLLKDRIVDYVILNSPEVSVGLAKFNGEVDYARGETLHMVSALETVSVVFDAKNQEKLTSLIPQKSILRVIDNLSEVVISLSEATMKVPGVAAVITAELAAHGINLVEYITATLTAIVVLESKDAMHCYQVLEDLASGEGR
ncbi:MAG TPA: adenylate/guanylate cyclase domain-containing protein [Conexivisphaerales archaeon]|nr:adenylate/guanylate cyclase domain-containing protein [Conexivisphaerales archaeon]